MQWCSGAVHAVKYAVYRCAVLCCAIEWCSEAVRGVE